jgi:hypothetical protein
VYTAPATERETVKGGTANTNRGSTESERFEDMHTTADAAIEEYRYPPLNYIGDTGKGHDCTRNVVQLTAAVVILCSRKDEIDSRYSYSLETLNFLEQ